MKLHYVTVFNFFREFSELTISTVICVNIIYKHIGFASQQNVFFLIHFLSNGPWKVLDFPWMIIWQSFLANIFHNHRFSLNYKRLFEPLKGMLHVAKV